MDGARSASRTGGTRRPGERPGGIKSRESVAHGIGGGARGGRDVAMDLIRMALVLLERAEKAAAVPLRDRRTRSSAIARNVSLTLWAQRASPSDCKLRGERRPHVLRRRAGGASQRRSEDASCMAPEAGVWWKFELRTVEQSLPGESRCAADRGAATDQDRRQAPGSQRPLLKDGGRFSTTRTALAPEKIGLEPAHVSVVRPSTSSASRFIGLCARKRATERRAE